MRSGGGATLVVNLMSFLAELKSGGGSASGVGGRTYLLRVKRYKDEQIQKIIASDLSFQSNVTKFNDRDITLLEKFSSQAVQPTSPAPIQEL